MDAIGRRIRMYVRDLKQLLVDLLQRIDALLELDVVRWELRLLFSGAQLLGNELLCPRREWRECAAVQNALSVTCVDGWYRAHCCPV